MLMAKIPYMKILFASEYYPPYVLGGAEISAQLLAEALAAHHRVDVLTPNYGAYKDATSRGACTVRRFASLRSFVFRPGVSGTIYRKSKGLFSMLRSLYERLSAAEFRSLIERQGSFDVIHAHNYESGLGLAAARVQAKTVVHLRDFRMATHADAMERIGRFVAISNFVRDRYVAAGFPEERIDVVYNPLPPALRMSKNVAKKKLSLRGTVALFAGQLVRRKGIDLLPRLAAQYPDYTFLAAGSGHDEALIRGNVRLLGFLPPGRLALYYRAADVVLVPSRWEEPFGRVAIEGQANGCIVIARRVGALPELIKDGKTGILADSDDGFARALDTLTGKRKKRIQANAVAAARAYRPAAIAARMEAVYASL